MALSAVSNWISNCINNRITYRTVQSLREESICHLQKLPLSYLDGHTVGDLVSRITADIDVISDGLLLGFTQLLTGGLTIAVTLVFMFSKNLSVSLLVVVLTPLSFLVARFISSRSFRLFQQQSVLRGKQTALVDEMIGGQKLVQAFDYTETASRRFAAINEDLMQCSQQAVFYSSLTNPSTRFVNSLIYAGVALLGIFLIPGGSLTVGGLTILLAYANQYMKPFNDISAVVTEFQNALACADRSDLVKGHSRVGHDAAARFHQEFRRGIAKLFRQRLIVRRDLPQPGADVDGPVGIEIAHAVAAAQIQLTGCVAQRFANFRHIRQHDIQRPLVDILFKDLGADMAVEARQVQIRQRQRMLDHTRGLARLDGGAKFGIHLAVGDIESQPYLEAIRQVACEKGRQNVVFIHVPLVQGDVGSGKTMVAAAAIVCAAKNGVQSALLAPTEILAEQYFQSLAPLFERLGLRCGQLTGVLT